MSVKIAGRLCTYLSLFQELIIGCCGKLSDRLFLKIFFTLINIPFYSQFVFVKQFESSFQKLEEFNSQLKQEKDQLSSEHQELLDSSKQVGHGCFAFLYGVLPCLQNCTVWICDKLMFWFDSLYQLSRHKINEHKKLLTQQTGMVSLKNHLELTWKLM